MRSEWCCWGGGAGDGSVRNPPYPYPASFHAAASGGNTHPAPHSALPRLTLAPDTWDRLAQRLPEVTPVSDAGAGPLLCQTPPPLSQVGAFNPHQLSQVISLLHPQCLTLTLTLSPTPTPHPSPTPNTQHSSISPPAFVKHFAINKSLQDSIAVGWGGVAGTDKGDRGAEEGKGGAPVKGLNPAADRDTPHSGESIQAVVYLRPSTVALPEGLRWAGVKGGGGGGAEGEGEGMRRESEGAAGEGEFERVV